jgi:hypothetical protein
MARTASLKRLGSVIDLLLGGAEMDLGSSWTYLLLGALALFLIGRQFVARPVSEKRLLALPLIAGVIGVQELVNTPPDGVQAAGLITLTVLAALLGIARATTVKIWQTASGTWMSRGGTLTLLLWVVAVGARVALALLSRRALPPAEVPLSLAATFAAQNLVLWLRTQGWTRHAVQAR